MTQAARLVLEDCRGALADLTDRVHGETWRRRWVTVIVLLRTVGHVLEKVDASNSPKLGTAIAGAWVKLVQSKPEPRIYWEFIHTERNNILKEYQIRAGHDITVFVGANRPPDFRYVINAGPYKGRLQAEVIAEAIAWWEQYLDHIDAMAV